MFDDDEIQTDDPFPGANHITLGRYDSNFGFLFQKSIFD